MSSLENWRRQLSSRKRQPLPPEKEGFANGEVKITCNLETIKNQTAKLLLSLYTYRDELGEREERVCKSLLHMAASECGGEVLKYLCQQGCVSNLEIIKNLGLSRQIVVHHLQSLEDLGLLRVYTTTENEVRLPAQYRGAKIRGWIGLPPEYSQQAIQRYLTFFKKEKPTTPPVAPPPPTEAPKQEEAAPRLFEEFAEDKTPPVRHRDFRNWLRDTRGLDFETAKGYADLMLSRGRVSP